MSTKIIQLFSNATEDASSPSFTCSVIDNPRDSNQGILIFGTADTASLTLEFLKIDSSGGLDSTDEANWQTLTLTNNPQFAEYFPLGNLPDILQLRLVISGAGSSTDLSAFLLKQQL